MNRNIPLVIAAVVALAGFALYVGWAFVTDGTELGDGSATFRPAWPFILGGGLVIAAFVGGLLWQGRDRRPGRSDGPSRDARD